jgi:hypothetical protein
MSSLLQILAIYVAASIAAGLTLGVALGTMIRRAERRHDQHVAQLMRSRTCEPLASSGLFRQGRTDVHPRRSVSSPERSSTGDSP